MMFRDRDDAACQLTEALAQYWGQHPLVLAIPRGAAPMARIIADGLGASSSSSSSSWTMVWPPARQ